MSDEAVQKRIRIIDKLDAMSDREVMDIIDGASFITKEMVLNENDPDHGFAFYLVKAGVPMPDDVLMKSSSSRRSVAYRVVDLERRPLSQFIDSMPSRAVMSQYQPGASGAHNQTLAHLMCCMTQRFTLEGYSALWTDPQFLSIQSDNSWTVAHEIIWRHGVTPEFWRDVYSKWPKETLSLLSNSRSVAGMLAGKGASFTDPEILRYKGASAGSRSVAHTMAENGYTFTSLDWLMYEGEGRNEEFRQTVASSMLVASGVAVDADEYPEVHDSTVYSRYSGIGQTYARALKEITPVSWVYKGQVLPKDKYMALKVGEKDV